LKNHSNTQINKIKSLIPHAMNREKYLFKRELLKLEKKDTNSITQFQNILSQLEKKIRISILKKNKRRQNIPKLIYNDDLPITSRRKEIVEKIKKHQVLIISGETGSGKTTQIPKFCLEAGRGINGKIACTQPRRIAAINVSTRIAQELFRWNLSMILQQ